MTDYAVGETLYLMFTTRQFSDGVPTVLAGTPVVSAYENDSVTQITAGITLGVDHDSVVGMNLLTIVATGANGYELGKDYNLVITTGTVGGVSVVGEVVGTFSLGRSAAAIDLANGTDGLGSLKSLIDTVDDFLDTEIAAIKTVVDSIVTDLDNGTDGLGALKALIDTVDNLLDTEIAAIKTDTAAILVDSAEIGAAGAGLTAVPWNSSWDAEVESEVNDALDTAMSELSQGIPTATPTIRTCLMLMYMLVRNKLVVQTSGTDAIEVYNDSGTKIAKKLITDDGSDYTEDEMTSGA